jgi:transposase-like protein
METKRSTRRQNHASAAQRLRMVEQFRRSGLTRVAFSRKHGIPLATLAWWLAKTKQVSNLPAPVVFSEVVLPPLTAAATTAWAMEVVAPSGLTVRCREAIPVRDLARLLGDTRC